MPSKNRPAKIDVAGTVILKAISGKDELVVKNSEKSIQVCIKKGDVTASPWLPKKCIEWVDGGLQIPVWLASRITKSDAVFHAEGEQAGLAACSGWNLVKAKTARLRHATNGEGNQVATMKVIGK